MACLRFYLLGMCELTIQINVVAGNNNDTWLLMTAAFSNILFGQIIDNITKNLKRLFVVSELVLGLWFFVNGFAYLSDSHDKRHHKMNSVIRNQVFPANFFLIAAI